MTTQLTYQVWSATEQGRRRSHNLDTIESRELAPLTDGNRSGAIWTLTSGFGNAPEQALQCSRIAARSIIECYRASADSDPKTRLKQAFQRTNERLFQANSVQSGANGATAIAVVIIENRLFIANAGRSRAYQITKSGTAQITQDHSWVAAEIAAGTLSPQEASIHPRRNVITRALGVEKSMLPDLFTRNLQQEAFVLLCSAGLTGYLNADQIASSIRQQRHDPARTLINRAREGGAMDDASVVVIRLEAEQGGAGSTARRLSILRRAGSSLGSSLDLEQTMNVVMQELLELLGGELAAIVLADEQGPQFSSAHQFTFQRGAVSTLPSEPANFSRSIVQTVIAESRPIISGNALHDPEVKAGDSIVGLALRSVLCVPLLGRQGTAGALYLDSSIQQRLFEQADLDLLVTFASQAATAIENARLHDEARKHNSTAQRARAQHESIIRSMSSALIAIDLDGTITTWNPAAIDLTGIQLQQAEGKHLRQVLPEALAAWLHALAAQAVDNDQTLMVGHNWTGKLAGRDLYLSANITILRSAEQRSNREGFAFLLNDQTELVRLEAARQAETERRQHIRDLFGRYVAPAVVDQLMQSEDSLRLGGLRQEVSVLFADLRGFASLAERRQPEDIVAILNHFLAMATREIHAELGTLDKFLGDGVMAIFNAPLPVPSHAVAAIRAGIRMRDRLAHTAQQAGVDIGFGIGINSGQAIVGNIGATELMNYTAIGDVVNVAARLQTEAKPGEILVSEATLERASRNVDAEALGLRKVKGRSQPIMIFRILDITEQE